MMSLWILRAVVTLVSCALPPIKAGATLVPSVDGAVYDTLNTISRLGNANLPASNRFGTSDRSSDSTCPLIGGQGGSEIQL
jgi:hypothetical protein